MRKVKWADIVAECDNYKGGFVATYLKYEGMPTDQTVRGKVVMVTQKSFAEHNKIPRQTFQAWIKMATDPAFASKDAQQARTAASHASVVKNLAKKNPRLLADAIQLAGVGAEDQVFHELKLRRAGIDTSPANRKAAEAAASAVGDAFKKAIKAPFVNLTAMTLDGMTEDLIEAIADGTISSKALDEIETAARRLLDTVVSGKAFVTK